MPTISNTNFYNLLERGFELISSHDGIELKITTKGLCWLLNYINVEKQYAKAITLSMLKAIASVEIDQNEWRELRFKCIPIEAYDSAVYYQYTFYLNGTPPKLFTSYSPSTTEINNSFNLPINSCAPFKIRDNSLIGLKFTDEQVQILKSGNSIIEK